MNQENIYKNPLISVITVVRNGEAYIEDCIKSVLSQKSDLYEYIVIDGQSTDHTIEIIKRYTGFINYFESSSDLGIFDAMNKGAAKARGEYLYFLNSDDFLQDNIFCRINKFLLELNEKPDILYGDIVKIDGNKFLKCKTPEDISYYLQFYNLPIHHPGTIISRYVFQKLNGFDSSFKYSADYDLFLRAFKNGLKFKKINIIFAKMRAGGIGTINLNQSLKEFYYSLDLNKIPAYVKIVARVRGLLVQILFKNNIISRSLKKIHILTIILRHGQYK
jgi:glycosyltransferase involved in cell wall biosynthesis